MDFERLLHNRKFYLAVSAGFAGILAGTAWPKAENGAALSCGTSLELLTGALSSQTVLFMLPPAAVLPFGEEYLLERQWNFLRFLLVRQTRKQYCRDRVLVTALSGALVWFLASLLALLFFFLAFFVREEAFVWPQEKVLKLLPVLGRVCLCGSALASLSAVCAVTGGSVYLAFGVPFLSWYALIILRSRYLESLYCIDPTEWIAAENAWGIHGNGLWMALILLALLSAAGHYAALEWRLAEL